MSVLIVVVTPFVYDTAAVAWGLHELCYDVDVWFPQDYPASASLSIELNSQDTARIYATTGLDDQQFGTKTFTSIWLRHRLKISDLSIRTNPADAAFAAIEADHLAQATLHLLSPSSMWVNHPRCNEEAFLKPLQLDIARKIGFNIPKTLMSNNPTLIHKFISELGGVAVFKTFNAATWESGNDSYLQSMCTLITKGYVNDSAALCPAIYQEVIAKQLDIRVIVMGKQLFAISQDSSQANYVDSRLSRRIENPHISPVTLPKEVECQYLQLMEYIGLVYGCIDLAKDKAGVYWFFEVNPNGQFLGYEEICPSLPLLDTFCEFLASGNQQYLRKQKRPRVRFKDFLKSDGIQTSLAWQQKHIQAPAKYIYRD